MKSPFFSCWRNIVAGKRFWFFLGAAAVLWIGVANIFPKDAVFISGDVVVPFRASEHFGNLLVENEGREMLFLLVFFFLDSVGLPPGMQASVFLMAFFLGSYVSAYGAVRAVFGSFSPMLAAAFSFAYAANLHTLAMTLSGEALTASAFLYVSMPILLAFFWRFLRTPSIRDGALVVLLVFCASASFVSPRFLIVLVLLLGLAFVAAMLFGWMKLRMRTIRAVILVMFASVAVCAYAIPSAAIALRFGESEMISDSVTLLEWRFVDASRSFMETLRLAPASMEKTFPTWFPYENWQWAAPLFILLSLISITWIYAGWLASKRGGDVFLRRIFWMHAVLLAVLMIFSTRLGGSWNFLNEPFFALPGFGALASHGTFAMIVPAVTLFIGVSAAAMLDRYRRIFAISAVLVAVSALPLFLGGLHRSASPILGDEYERDAWKEAPSSALVQFPEEYEVFGEWLRENGGAGKVARLPHSVSGNAVGWEYLPDIGLLGADPFASLWDRDVVSPNAPYFDHWLFADTFSSSDENPAWLTALLGLAHVRYVIVHHDALDSSVEVIMEKVEYLEQIGEWTSVYESKSFDVYELRSDRVSPRVFISESLPALMESPRVIRVEADRILETEKRSVLCERPKEGCSFVLKEDDAGKRITLSEPPSHHWEARIISEDGEETRLPKVLSAGFFTGWDLPSSVSGGETVWISHAKYRFFFPALALSIFTVVCASMVAGVACIRKRKM